MFGTTYLTQNFAGGNPVSQYVSAGAPTNAQWTRIAVSGAGDSVSAASNALVFVHVSGNAGGDFSRIVDFSPVPVVLKYQFDFSVTVAASLNTAVQFKVGAGFANTTTPEINSNTYGRFGVDFINANQWRIRDLIANVGGNTYSGTQTITWFLNKSGSTITYTAPDGSSETLANDKMDIWVGTTKEFNDIAIQTSGVAMTDLKFIFSTAISATVTMDNFNITGDPAATAVPFNIGYIF